MHEESESSMGENSDEQLWELAVSSNLKVKAAALFELGYRADCSHQHDRALTLIDEAIEAWEQTERERETGYAWFVRGCVLHYHLDRHDEALSSVGRAREYYGLESPDSWHADLDDLEASVLLSLGDNHASYDLFQRARAGYVSAGDVRSAAMASVYAALASSDDVVRVEALEFAYEQFRVLDDVPSVWRARHDLIAGYSVTDRCEEGHALACENLNLAVFLDDDDLVCQSRIRLSEVLETLGRATEAIDQGVMAFRLAQQNKDWWNVINARSAIAVALRAMGRDDEAADHDAAIASFLRAVGRDGRADVMDARALTMEWDRGSSAQVIFRLHESITAAERRGDKAAERSERLRLASYYMRFSESERALDVLHLIFPSDWPDVESRVAHMLLLARIASGLRRHEECRVHAQRARDIAERHGLHSPAAEALEILMTLADGDNDESLANALRHQAVALFLQGGDTMSATRLSLPDVPQATIATAIPEVKIGEMPQDVPVGSEALPSSPVRGWPTSGPRRSREP